MVEVYEGYNGEFQGEFRIRAVRVITENVYRMTML